MEGAKFLTDLIILDNTSDRHNSTSLELTNHLALLVFCPEMSTFDGKLIFSELVIKSMTD